MTTVLASLFALTLAAAPAPVLVAQKTPTPLPEAAQKDAPVAAKAPTAPELAQKVQRFYEKTSDYSADFQQVYRYQGSARRQVSSGTMQVKKPGLMRWDYDKPYPKHFVLDGKALYLYDPEDKQVTVNRDFTTDQLSAAVTFLWGRGKLTDEFDVALAAASPTGDAVLELTPKKPQSGFTKLLFHVDAATGQVKTSIVVDSQGNENRIDFANVKTNTGIPASRFEFKIPKGAKVTEWKAQ